MRETATTYDVWLVGANTVYKGVPFDVVSDWVQQARLGPNDRARATGAGEWQPIAELPLFEPYLPRTEAQRVEDPAEAYEPVELDFSLKRKHADEDDDVDMIPLIDISLVLLIFFMMTTTVASISRILVPEMANAVKVDANANTLCISMDKSGDEGVEYGIAKGSESPRGPNAGLSEQELFQRLDELLSQSTEPVKIRIAAHKALPYEQVERVMKELDRRKSRGVAISEYTAEVGERYRQ